MKKCALKDLKTLKICRCGEIKNRIDMSSRLTRDSYRVKTAKLVNKTFCSREWNWNRISSLTRDAISHATGTSPKKQYRRWTERESRTSGWLKRTDPPLTPVVSFAIVVSQVRSISVSAVTWCCDTNGNKCRGVLSAPYTCATVRQSAFICRARPTHANSCPSNIEPSTMHVSSSLSLSPSLSLSLSLSVSLSLCCCSVVTGSLVIPRWNVLPAETTVTIAPKLDVGFRSEASELYFCFKWIAEILSYGNISRSSYKFSNFTTWIHD